MMHFQYSALVLALNETNEELDDFFRSIPAFFNKIICVTPNIVNRASIDTRVVFLKDKKEGPEKAINSGLALINDGYVSLLFPGDVVNFDERDLPNSIDQLVYSQMLSETSNGFQKPRYNKFWFRKICMPQINLIGAYIPVVQLKSVGGFPTKYKVSNDHELILKLDESGVVFKEAKFQSVYFAKGGISTQLYEVGMAESARISGFPYNVFGILLGAVLVVKNKGSLIKYIKNLR